MNCFLKQNAKKKKRFLFQHPPFAISLEKFLSEIHRSSALLRPCSDWCFECLWLQVLGPVKTELIYTSPLTIPKLDMQKRHSIWYFYIFLTFFFWWNFSLVTSPKNIYVFDVFWVVCSCLVVLSTETEVELHVFTSSVRIGRSFGVRAPVGSESARSSFQGSLGRPQKKQGGRSFWLLKLAICFLKYPTKIIFNYEVFLTLSIQVCRHKEREETLQS